MSIENDDLDLSQVDLSRPLIDQQTVRCRVADVKIEEKDGKKNFNVVVTTEGAATSKDGKTLQPGFKHTESILMTPTGGLTQEMINEKLARFQKATLGTQGRLLPLDQYVGKEVDVTFGVRDGKDGGQFQTIKRWNAAK